MDRRTQRYGLVLLLIALTFVLYRSLGSEAGQRYVDQAASYGGLVEVDEGPGEMELRRVEPANATLGVS